MVWLTTYLQLEDQKYCNILKDEKSTPKFSSITSFMLYTIIPKQLTFSLRIIKELCYAVNKVCPIKGVSTNTDTGGLSKTNVSCLEDLKSENKITDA